MAKQHTKQLAIDDAQKGIELFAKRIESLEALQRELLGPPEAKYPVVLEKMKEEADQIRKESRDTLGSFGGESDRAREAAKEIEDISESVLGMVHSSERIIKLRIARVKDIISDIVDSLKIKKKELETPPLEAMAQALKATTASDATVLRTDGKPSADAAPADITQNAGTASPAPLKTTLTGETNSPPQMKEIFTLKPSLWGVSIDLKELLRRGVVWLKEKQ